MKEPHRNASKSIKRKTLTVADVKRLWPQTRANLESVRAPEVRSK